MLGPGTKQEWEISKQRLSCWENPVLLSANTSGTAASLHVQLGINVHGPLPTCSATPAVCTRYAVPGITPQRTPAGYSTSLFSWPEIPPAALLFCTQGTKPHKRTNNKHEQYRTSRARNSAGIHQPCTHAALSTPRKEGVALWWLPSAENFISPAQLSRLLFPDQQSVKITVIREALLSTYTWDRKYSCLYTQQRGSQGCSCCVKLFLPKAL